MKSIDAVGTTGAKVTTEQERPAPPPVPVSAARDPGYPPLVRPLPPMPKLPPAPSSSEPRIVLSGPDWRVVATELADQHGVLTLNYVIELVDGTDAMRQPRWRELTAKSAMSDWVTAARRFLDELLKAAGEAPNAKPRF